MRFGGGAGVFGILAASPFWPTFPTRPRETSTPAIATCRRSARGAGGRREAEPWTRGRAVARRSRTAKHRSNRSSCLWSLPVRQTVEGHSLFFSQLPKKMAPSQKHQSKKSSSHAARTPSTTRRRKRRSPIKQLPDRAPTPQVPHLACPLKARRGPAQLPPPHNSLPRPDHYLVSELSSLPGKTQPQVGSQRGEQTHCEGPPRAHLQGRLSKPAHTRAHPTSSRARTRIRKGGGNIKKTGWVEAPHQSPCWRALAACR
jgi:hypothetical protein